MWNTWGASLSFRLTEKITCDVGTSWPNPDTRRTSNGGLTFPTYQIISGFSPYTFGVARCFGKALSGTVMDGGALLLYVVANRLQWIAVGPVTFIFSHALSSCSLSTLHIYAMELGNCTVDEYADGLQLACAFRKQRDFLQPRKEKHLNGTWVTGCLQVQLWPGDTP